MVFSLSKGREKGTNIVQSSDPLKCGIHMTMKYIKQECCACESDNTKEFLGLLRIN